MRFTRELPAPRRAGVKFSAIVRRDADVYLPGRGPAHRRPRCGPTPVLLTLVIANDPGFELTGSVSTLVIGYDPRFCSEGAGINPRQAERKAPRTLCTSNPRLRRTLAAPYMPPLKSCGPSSSPVAYLYATPRICFRVLASTTVDEHVYLRATESVIGEEAILS